jgi:hypothetical protein
LVSHLGRNRFGDAAPNHANLFDGGYARQAERMMQKLLAG